VETFANDDVVRYGEGTKQTKDVVIYTGRYTLEFSLEIYFNWDSGIIGANRIRNAVLSNDLSYLRLVNMNGTIIQPTPNYTTSAVVIDGNQTQHFTLTVGGIPNVDNTMVETVSVEIYLYNANDYPLASNRNGDERLLEMICYKNGVEAYNKVILSNWHVPWNGQPQESYYRYDPNGDRFYPTIFF